MAVWWSPTPDDLADRNGESPLVPKDFLDESNFQHLYQGTGEPRPVAAKELSASFACAVNAFVQHYWTCRQDYEVSVDRQVEGSGHVALEEMTPKWHDDLVTHYGIGEDPEACIKLYTSGTMVVVRRLFKTCSLAAGGTTLHPECSELPAHFKLGQTGRPTSMGPTDEAGQATRALFRLFQYPDGIPEVDYKEFIRTNFSEWTGNKPVHFFERKPFYRALNCAISQDAPNVLKGLMPIIMDMNYFINQVPHPGGVFYSGVGLGTSLHTATVGAKLRMPRFLSTTADVRFAKSRITDKVGPALLVVRIPHGFWGARSIASVSSCPEEAETLFCAHALFLVEQVSTLKIKGKEVSRIDLKALDKYDGIGYPASAYVGNPPALDDAVSARQFTRNASEE